MVFHKEVSREICRVEKHNSLYPKFINYHKIMHFTNNQIQFSSKGYSCSVVQSMLPKLTPHKKWIMYGRKSRAFFLHKAPWYLQFNWQVFNKVNWKCNIIPEIHIFRINAFCCQGSYSFEIALVLNTIDFNSIYIQYTAPLTFHL